MKHRTIRCRDHSGGIRTGKARTRTVRAVSNSDRHRHRGHHTQRDRGVGQSAAPTRNARQGDPGQEPRTRQRSGHRHDRHCRDHELSRRGADLDVQQHRPETDAPTARAGLLASAESVARILRSNPNRRSSVAYCQRHRRYAVGGHQHGNVHRAECNDRGSHHCCSVPSGLAACHLLAGDLAGVHPYRTQDR